MSGPAAPELWRAVDRLVGGAASIRDLRAHGLHLLAARWWRRIGRPVGAGLRRDERVAAARTLVAPLVLEHARAAVDGPLLLMKGPELAARYPDPALRPFRDLDLLVERPCDAQRALLAAGFRPLGPDEGAYDGRHHLQPLALPGTPLVVEVHRRPEWPKWSAAPDPAELLDAAVPSATGVDGVLALPPAWHAVAVAAHSWSEAPLRRVLDLVDVEALAAEAGRGAVAEVAERLGLAGVVAAMLSAGDAVLGSAPPSRPLRLWARDVHRVRDSTVFENHLARVLSPFSVLPPAAAVRLCARELGRTLRPAAGEPWTAKTARTAAAVRDAFGPLAEHHARAG